MLRVALRPCPAKRCAVTCTPELRSASSLPLRTVRRRRRICSSATNDISVQKTVLDAQMATADSFRPFGQLISATDDGKEFDEQDAQLVLDQGASVPRFYIMNLPRRGLTFDRITYHASVTQCLGSVNPEPWYLVVAEPTGSVEKFPRADDLHAFRIPHGAFVKLHQATWHAGPLFDGADSMSFFNLELADTNVVDHNTHAYTDDNLQFEVRERDSRNKRRWWTDTLREQ